MLWRREKERKDGLFSKSHKCVVLTEEWEICYRYLMILPIYDPLFSAKSHDISHRI